ncbi:MAG: hypothetical protein J1E61_09630 [Lachnospiraceae bacterium]|nr:hypothetical protein [Lachnospiraceae bacterium]
MDAKTTGIIAYLTFIGWVLALCLGDKEGAKFHINQALVVNLFGVGAFVIGWIPFIGWLYGVFVLVCGIMGLIFACQGEEKEVPLLGKIIIMK